MTDREDEQAMDRVEQATAAIRKAEVLASPPLLVIASTVETLQTLDNQLALARCNSTRTLTLRAVRYGGVCSAVSLLIVAGWFVFSTPGAGISFAQVSEKISAARSFSYEVVNEPLGNTQSPGWEKNITKVLFKEPGFLREERANGAVMIQNITAGKTLRYDRSTKTATLYPFKPQLPWLGFRKFFLEEGRKFVDGAEPRLQEQEVDGKKAQGFAVRENEDSVWNIWVDARTGRLLRLEHVNRDWKTVMSKIVLDPDLPNAVFNVEPPMGYDLTTWKD